MITNANLKRNSKVRIKSDHKFHANKIGYFYFEGTGSSKGAFVFTEKPSIESNEIRQDRTYGNTFFAVGADDFELI